MAKDDDKAPPAADAKPGFNKQLLFFAGIVLIAIGASVGGTVWFLGGSEPAASQAAAMPVHKMAIYHDIRPAFFVNYMVGNKPRVLQAEFAVVSRDAAVIEGVIEHMPIIRNRLIDVLGAQDFVALQTEAGKEALLQEIRTDIDGVLKKETGASGVESVLITNFVMQ